MKQVDYTSESIFSLSDMEHMRHRTSAYIPDTGIQGQITVVREIIDNAIDELELLYANAGQLNIVLFLDKQKNEYSVVIQDNGRGIPVGEKLISSFANARTSGKYDGKAGYTSSSGLFGIGSTVTLALSSWFRVISKNKEVIGDVTLHYDNIPSDITTIANQDGTTGMIVMFSPDVSVFTEVSEYIEKMGDLIDKMSQLSIFCKFGIKLYVIDEPISDITKSGNTEAVLNYIESVKNNIPVFDNCSFNKENYIRSFFGITKKWDGTFHIEGTNITNTLRVNGDLFISLSSNLSGNNKLTLVNNITFTDNTSYHITILQQFLKNKLAYHITDKGIKDFFLLHYKLPIWLILDVKFNNAQFAGFAKVSFRDINVKQPYQTLLSLIIPNDEIAKIYEIIKDHIITQHSKFSNADFKPTSMRNLLSRLNRPDKFNNCRTSDRESAELFLVEGDSAKSDQSRKAEFQANYILGGKPFNGLTTIEKLSESINNIKKNRIFQDIIRILNITPGSDDLSKMNFGKILIMADADTHGYHITDIVTGNLLAICPALLDQGRVYAVIPPLYSLNAKGQDRIYIKDEEELNATLSYHLYHRCLDIRIKSSRYDRVLSREEFVAFTEIIMKVSVVLETLAEEYVIPAMLLEQIALMTSYVDFDNPDTNLISKWLGCPVRYVSVSRILMVSMGSNDIIIPLGQIIELIYAKILPLYREFYYGKIKIFATTKRTETMKDTPVSITMLSEIFKQLNSMFTISRYKGLGNMLPEDIATTCTDPATRRVHQITSIGDVKTIFEMMGTDSSYRKRLVIE